MSNDNGFPAITINYASDIGYINQGAVIGMSFGWIVGSILLYVLGMCMIRIYFKRFYHQSQKSSDQPRHRKPSTNSDQPALKGHSTLPKSRRQQQTQNPGQHHKRKLYHQNPTMEMIEVTNQDETFKKMKNSYNPGLINLDLEERIEKLQ